MTRVTLTFDAPAGPGARLEHLRGAIAGIFGDCDWFHQHSSEEGENRVLYRYPLIHYRVLERDTGMVVGLTRAAEKLAGIEWLGHRFQLGGRDLSIARADLDLSREPVAIADRLIRYRFRSAWLPYNRRNYERSRGLDATATRLVLDRLLVAHLLAMPKGIDVHFPERLYAALLDTASRSYELKGVPLVGITGEFVCNMELPSGLALGKAVSHGFGWIEPLRGNGLQAAPGAGMEPVQR